MRCGTGHPETRSRSPRSTRLRCVPWQRRSLPPTRSWPWRSPVIPGSPLAGRQSTQPRARFKWGRGWAARRGAPAQSRGHRSRCPSPGVTAAPCAPRGRRAAQCAGNRRIGAAELSGRSRRVPHSPVGRGRSVPSRAGSGRGSSGLPGSTRHAAAADRRGEAAVKQLSTGLLVAAMTVTGCKKAPAPDMQGMPGMPGMPAAGADTSGVPLERAEAARLGITFARAAERPVRSSVRAVGILKYAEPNLVYVNARVAGWVERLYADYVGKRVEQGDPLLALYSPDLVSAQEEYLLARRLKDDTLAASARRRLALWDVPADQIDSLETRASVTRTLLLRAPRSGAVTEKTVIEGQAVKSGDNLFQIADARVLWVDVAI